LRSLLSYFADAPFAIQARMGRQFTRTAAPSARPPWRKEEVRLSAAAPRAVGFIARGAFYLLIAFAFFFIVDLCLVTEPGFLAAANR
jgi:hypothetical protein